MQQVSAISIPSSFRGTLLLVAATLMLAGCKKEEVQSYSAPKDGSAAASAAPPKMAPGTVTVPADASPVHWTTPAGWQEQPAGGMRVGSFMVNKDGQTGDVSIVPLGGGSGGELANVNRWRGQVGLEPIDEAKLAGSAEKVSIGNAPAFLYEMAGTDPKTKQPARIIGSMLPAEGTTWFFKMTGPEALVAQEKPVFKEFLQSIRFGAIEGGGQVAHAPVPMSTNGKGLPASFGQGEGTGDRPAWDVPGGWQEQPPTSMRLATFLIAGENGVKADVSVIKLAGPAGGTLSNVNRWRSQVGLPPVDESGLEKLITTKDVNGMKVIFVDMAGRSVESGQQSRLLAAIVPRSGVTWFYKMLGDDQLVAQQKAGFAKFVESARYPNAS